MPSPFAPNLRMNSIFPQNPGPVPNDFSGNMPQIDFGGTPMQATDMGEGSPVFASFDESSIQPEMSQFDPIARMNELYTPETQASERFNTLASSMPQYQKPGFWRTMAAALSAFGPGGHETGMAVANQPYQQKMTDWKNQIGPAQQAATLERQTNVNERTLAYQQVSQELRARADEERAKNNEKSAQIRQQRADVYEFKAKNPNMKLVFPKGGNIQAIDPITGQARDLGIPTGTLSETDKINMQQEDRVELQDDRQKHETGMEQTKQTNRVALKQTVPGKATTSNNVAKAESPSQIRTRQYNSAQELKNTRPDLAQFLTIEPGGRFSIEPPAGENFFGMQQGPNQAQYDEIKKFIYGEAPAISQPTRTGAPSPAASGSPGSSTGSVTTPTATSSKLPAGAKVNAQGRVRMMSPDGKPVTLPPEQLQDAIKQGFKLR